MAISVMNWVLEEAPDLPAHCLGVLMALASKARDDGTGARPGQKWLAERARKTSRQVRSDLAKLEELKLIRRGDQSLVAHLPADERPVVWDLAIERSKPKAVRSDAEMERKSTSGRKPTSARKEGSARAETEVSDQEEQGRDRNSTSARKPASGRNFTSGGERKWASDNTSFDKSSSSPSEKRGSARARTTVEGARLLQEHIAACRLPPSKDLRKQTSEEIDKLLAEKHITADHVRAGLALLRSKPHLGPRLLQNLVFEAANKGAGPLPATGTDGPNPLRTGALANVNDLWKR